MGCLVLKLPSNVQCLKFLMLHRVHTFLIVADGTFHSTQTSRAIRLIYTVGSRSATVGFSTFDFYDP